MYTTKMQIGTSYQAHAQSECKETAVAETIRLSREIVNWKEGATPKVTIICPKGNQYERYVTV